MKSPRLRPAAIADLDRASGYYLTEANLDIAIRFERMVRETLMQVAEFPGSGSPHFGMALNIPGLRTVQTVGFPYTLFYFERDDHLDVVRLLHQRQDIPMLLSDETPDESAGTDSTPTN